MRPLAALAPLAIALAAGTAHGETFDELAAKATRMHLDEVVWSIAAPACTTGNDVEQRQCRTLHARVKARREAAASLLVEVERAAFTFGAWDPAKKVVPYRVSSCLACLASVELDGKRYAVVLAGNGAKVVKTEKQPKFAVISNVLYEDVKPFADEAAAKAWIASLTPVRVEMIVSNPKVVTIDGLPVVEVTSAGYRVITPCDGRVVVAFPSSAALPADKRACPKAP